MSFILRVDDLLDRANPVLVAEVRRALRGKAFLVAFLMVQTAVVLAAIAWGTAARDEDGRTLLGILFGILQFAAYVYVPIVAFQSMAGEVDRGSLDHLLAPLRPWRVVLGKWLTGMTLLALLASACLPFACLALLAGGIDPRETAGLLAHALVYSSTATMFALWFAVLGSSRTARTLLLVLLFVTVLLGGFAVQFTMARVLGPGGYRGAFGWRLAPLVAYGFVGVGAFLAACARIAHPHENKSTPLRLWGTAAVALLGFSWRGGGGDLHGAFFALALLWAMGVVFASEPDGDLRWFRRHIPRERALTLVAAPWMPGGAFGCAWIALHAGLLVLVSGLDRGDASVLFVLSLLAGSLAVLPTSLLPRIRGGVSTRFVRTVALLLPFFLAAANDAVGAVIGVGAEGLLPRLFDLELDRFDNDLAIPAILLAAAAGFYGLRRLGPELVVLERLRVRSGPRRG